MNQILARLETLGLVERRGHPEHGRVLQAHLTRSGERLWNECTRIVTTVEKRMVSEFSEEEQRCLLEALRRCAEALRKDN